MQDRALGHSGYGFICLKMPVPARGSGSNDLGVPGRFGSMFLFFTSGSEQARNLDRSSKMKLKGSSLGQERLGSTI
jgi:hypothetical protein